MRDSLEKLALIDFCEWLERRDAPARYITHAPGAAVLVQAYQPLWSLALARTEDGWILRPGWRERLHRQ